MRIGNWLILRLSKEQWEIGNWTNKATKERYLGLPKPPINLKELRETIRDKNYRRGILRVLKEELSLLGHWKNRPRGNPKKGYAVSKEKKDTG